MDLRRLQDDLSGFIRGDLLFDDINRHLYSTDASIFQVKPAGVVLPRDEDDVCKLVHFAQEQGLALIARGAGTGLAGESLGAGLIVDMSKHFRQIVEVGDSTVRVQPGVTLAGLNAKLAERGRRFAPDPANGSVCTIGGMLANNASGSRAILHGYTRDHALSLRVVLDNGEAVSVTKDTLTHLAATPNQHLRDIATSLHFLLEQNRDDIRRRLPRTPFNRFGYRLDGILEGESLDLPGLLIGSEGTLGLFTEATLRTVPIPAGRALAALSFASLERALQTVGRVMRTRPSACELMDRRLLTLARSSDSSASARYIAPAAEAVLLVEYETAHPAEADRLAKDLVEMLRDAEPGVFEATIASRPAELEALWQLRETALPSLYGLKGSAQPIAYIEDVGVPLDTLHEYIRRVQDILQEHETTASFLVHAGAGQVHTRPFLDLRNQADASKLWSIAEKVHALAIELGGTVSSQHGAGLARTPWVARQYGTLYPVFRQVKAIFDPKNIFNPGKIVDPDPNHADRPLRLAAVVDKPIPLKLTWSDSEAKTEANRCNGCGECRTDVPQQRMCPIFRGTHGEDATPRAKANLVRTILASHTGGPQLSAEAVRGVADLCVHCKMCATECPAHIDIPKLMLEAKAANVAEHGFSRSDWYFAHLEALVRWGSAVSFLTNLSLRSRTSRWLFDKLLGISSQRRLPRFASRPFMARAKRRGWTRKPTGAKPVVVYFVDLYANFIDPQVAEATVAVLHHHGYDVYVPPTQRGSGLEALTHGDIDTAREIAQKNLRALVEPARAGWPIICSEPSAALALKEDYLDLIDDDDAKVVAENTVELTTFLWRLQQQGKLRGQLQPLDISIGHHVPCHMKALQGPIAGPDLISLIPRTRVHSIDVGCSGMAGTFGLKSANYRLSQAAGAMMLTELRRPRSLFGSAECSSCRMQMEDGTEKRSLHPVQYLALAYGLLPEVADRLREPVRELVLR